MNDKEKPTHTMPGARQENNSKPDDGVVNDSLGTVDSADTTGTGEETNPADHANRANRATSPAGREIPDRENNGRDG